MWVSGDPVEEKSISTGRVVAWCLTIAAILSAVGVAAEAIGFSGFGIRLRIVQAALSSLYPVALALAATVTLSLTDAGSEDLEQPSRLRSWADGSLALAAAAVVAASAFAMACFLDLDLLGERDLGGSVSWRFRIGALAASLASLLLGMVALFVIGRDRRRFTSAGPVPDSPVDSVSHAVESPAGRIAGPAVGYLLATVVAMLTTAVATAFASSGSVGGQSGFSFGTPGRSVGERIADASQVFSSMPIALAALAVVMLVAVGTRREPRRSITDLIATTAAIVGLVAIVAAGYATWHAVAADPITAGPESFFSDAWARLGTVGAALASGTLGLAACYVQRHLPSTRPVDHVVRRSRFDPRVVATCLVIAALVLVASQVNTVVDSDTGLPAGELIVQLTSSLLLTVGLALAAVIVMTSSRRELSEPAEPTARDGGSIAVNVIAAGVALVTLAFSAYAVVYVLFGTDESRLSFVAHATTSQRVGYVATAVATGLVATAVLHFILGARRPLAKEPKGGDDVDVVDLV
jgi:hypothetical protein